MGLRPAFSRPVIFKAKTKQAFFEAEAKKRPKPRPGQRSLKQRPRTIPVVFKSKSKARQMVFDYKDMATIF